MDFVYDKNTGLYTAAELPGQFFRYNFKTESYDPAEPPLAVPANGADDSPGAGEQPQQGSAPAGFPADAVSLAHAYVDLPLSERKRFWMLIDEAEESFSIEEMRKLVLKADAASINFLDREAFEKFLKSQGEKPANGDGGAYLFAPGEPSAPRAYILGPEHPANGPSGYEHALIQANNGDPSVWYVQAGKRHGIPAPHVMRERFHSTFEDGRWTGVLYVDPSEVASIPVGAPVLSPYEGKLLQAGQPHQDLGIALGALLGPAAGAAAGLSNLVPADPKVWHIVNGKRQHVASEDVLRSRYGSAWEEGILGAGHWSKVQLVDPALIAEFPVGPTETMAGNVGGTGSAGGTPAGAPPG